MRTLLLVFIAGGAGSLTRYLISKMMAQCNVLQFPFATFTVNILGCFLIGLISISASRLHWNDDIRLMLTVGFCGGFTTFSTFCNEGLTLLKNGNFTTFVIYTVTSIALGILATTAGYILGKE